MIADNNNSSNKIIVIIIIIIRIKKAHIKILNEFRKLAGKKKIQHLKKTL